MIELKNVTKIYNQGEEQVAALSDFSCVLGNKGLVTIVGESGCGKTTLLNILSGFDKPTSGKVMINGKDISLFGQDEKNSYHGIDVGFVFQEYNVLEQLTVYENVKLPLEILDINTEQKEKLINDTLSTVGLGSIRNKQVSNLSGGQKQRVAIARACVKKPRIILADEPTGNLDIDNSKIVFELLKKVSNDILVIVVTHDKHLALEYSDRIITLKDGEIESDEKVGKDNYLYRLSKDGENISNGSVYDLVSEIKKYLKDKSNDQMVLEVEHRVVIEEEKKESLTEEKREIVHNICSLKNKEIAVLSHKMLNKRKLRKWITTVTFSLTVFLLLFVVAFINYNEDKVITSYLDSYDDEYVFIEKELDSIYETVNRTETAYITEEMLSIVRETPDIKNTCYQYNSVSFENGEELIDISMLTQEYDARESFSIDVTARIITNKEYEDKFGLESIANGMCITDYVATITELDESDIGKEFSLGGEIVVLQAIYDTQYENEEICNESHLTEEEEYVLNQEYNVIYLSDKYVEYHKNEDSKNGIHIRGNSFFEKSLFGYVNNSLDFNDVSVEYENIIGRLPQKDNEILIAYALLDDLGVVEGEEENAIGKKIALRDLYGEQYGNAFSNRMNLYDYLGEFVEIVGVADTENAGCDICVSENTYDRIKEDYYAMFSFDRLGIHSDDWKGVVQELHSKGIRFSDPNIDMVYSLVDMRPSIIKYLIVMLVIMIVLNAFLMISFISYSIKDNAKIIGIIKSLGIKDWDIKKIFLIEPIGITIKSIFIACLLLFIAICVINVEAAGVMMFRKYSIVIIQWISIVWSGLLTLAYAILCAWIPMKTMDKQTIIDVIRT